MGRARPLVSSLRAPRIAGLFVDCAALPAGHEAKVARRPGAPYGRLVVAEPTKCELSPQAAEPRCHPGCQWLARGVVLRRYMGRAIISG